MLVDKTAILNKASVHLVAGERANAFYLLTLLAMYEVERHMWDEMLEDEDYIKPKSFSALHDTCDANEFGGLCAVLIPASFNTLKDDTEADEEWIAFADKLQAKVDLALKRNKLVPQLHVFI